MNRGNHKRGVTSDRQSDAGGVIIVGGHIHGVNGCQPHGPEHAKAKIALVSAAFTLASLIPAGEGTAGYHRHVLVTVSLDR